MVEFRATYIGHSMVNSWGIERIEGDNRELLPQHFGTQQAANTEAERLNNLEAAKNA